MDAEEINKLFFKFYKLDLEIYSFNPFLRISKPTEAKMKSYRSNKLSIIVHRILFTKCIIILVISYRITFNSIYNAIRYAVYKKPRKEVLKTDVIFLSHLTSRNIDSSKDSFFGALPDVIKYSGKNIGMIYTNQIREQSKSRIKEIEANNNFVISKYLQMNELIRFYVCALRAVKYTLGESKNYRNSNVQTKHLIAKACLSFLTIETMMNFHLIEEVRDLIFRYKPSYIFLTFEGHIFENSIYLSCVNNPSIQKIFMCQNSPIVTNQFGFFDFLKNPNPKLTILVQGSKYLELVTERNKDLNAISIGKEEDYFDFGQTVVGNNSKRMLLVPDGHKSSVKFFLGLTNYFYNALTCDISISLHPDTHIGARNQKRLNDLKRIGLIKEVLSGLKIDNLKDYEYLVYSSSSIAVKSLFWKNKLIYACDSDYDINPLGIISGKIISSVYVEDIKLDIINYPQSEYFNFYSELDYSPILEIIKT
jgi:hypothetical protein